MTNAKTGLDNFFAAICPQSWKPFARTWFNVEKFVLLIGWIAQDCCHTFCMKLLINALISLKGTLRGKISSDNAFLADLSASLLPLILIWLGSQQKTISARLHNLDNFSRRMTTSGLSVFSPSSACIADKESVCITYHR